MHIFRSAPRLFCIVFVCLVLLAGFVVPAHVVYTQNQSMRMLVVPERVQQWEALDMGAELMSVDPFNIGDMLLASVSSGDMPDMAEVPAEYVEMLVQAAPDAIFDLDQVAEGWQSYNLQPFQINFRTVGIFIPGGCRVLVVLNTPYWLDGLERLSPVFEIIYAHWHSCVSCVVHRTEAGTGQHQQQQQAQDQQQDLMLYHPEFEETFDVVYDPSDPVLQAFDIVGAEYMQDGDSYIFTISLASEDAISFMRENPQTGQIGVFLDADLNGASDYIVMTTGEPERSMLLTSQYEPVAETEARFDRSEIVLTVPVERLREDFDWAVFSAYSPRPDAFYVSATSDLPIVPIVDMLYPPQEIHPQYIFQIQQQQSQQQNQTNETIFFTCPVSGATQYETLLWQHVCPDRWIKLWCIGGTFAREVWSNTGSGYIAKCPYVGGNNWYKEYPDANGVPQLVHHWVFDKYNRMDYLYEFSSNSDWITNTKAGSSGSTTCQPYPSTPFSYYYSVPGYCP